MKRALVALLLILAVVGVALVVAPWLVATDQLNARIAAHLSQLTGREVSFTGETTVRLFPSTRIELRNVRVAGPTGFESDPLLEVAMIRGRVSRLPLLMGRVDIETYELYRPRFHLQVGSGDGSHLGLMAGVAFAGAPADRLAELGGIEVGNFIVSDGSILFDDGDGTPLTEFTNVNFRLAWPSLARSAVIGGAARWRGEEVEFNGTLGAPLALLSGQPSSLRFAAASVPLRLSLEGSVSNAAGLQLDGDASVTTPSIRQLIAWTGGTVSQGASLNVGSIRGRLRLVDRVLSIADGRFEVDGNEGEGVASLKLAGPRPAVQATLAFKSLDLTPYWETFQAGLRSAGAWFLAPIDLAPLQQADIDLRLSSPQLRAGDIRVGNFGGTLVASDGRLSVNIAQAELHGGRLRASLQGEVSGDRLHGTVQARADGLSAGSVLAAAVGADGLRGTAAISAELEADGRNWGEFVGGLAGRVAYEVAGGTVNGIDVVRFARTALARPNDEAAPDYAGTTAFAALKGSAAVAGGVLTTDDTVMEGKDFSLNLSGTAVLAATAVRGQGSVRLAGGQDGQAVPFRIGGTWFNPILSVDRRASSGDPAEPDRAAAP